MGSISFHFVAAEKLSECCGCRNRDARRKNFQGQLFLFDARVVLCSIPIQSLAMSWAAQKQHSLVGGASLQGGQLRVCPAVPPPPPAAVQLPPALWKRKTESGSPPPPWKAETGSSGQIEQDRRKNRKVCNVHNGYQCHGGLREHGISCVPPPPAFEVHSTEQQNLLRGASPNGALSSAATSGLKPRPPAYPPPWWRSSAPSVSSSDSTAGSPAAFTPAPLPPPLIPPPPSSPERARSRSPAFGPGGKERLSSNDFDSSGLMRENVSSMHRYSMTESREGDHVARHGRESGRNRGCKDLRFARPFALSHMHGASQISASISQDLLATGRVVNVPHLLIPLQQL